MNKEIKIVPPEGYEIDVLNSNLECIKFKPIKKERWRDNENIILNGYYIASDTSIIPISIEKGFRNVKSNFNIFATEKQVKSAIAMARISQIMTNDERFGGPITDEEWNDVRVDKYTIDREYDMIRFMNNITIYKFLSFHTTEQRDLFLEENEDLVKDYLMID